MYVSGNDTDRVLEGLDRLKPGPENVALIFLSEKNCPDLELLTARLNARGVKFVGGVFPGFIMENRFVDEGAHLEIVEPLADPVAIDVAAGDRVTAPHPLGDLAIEHRGNLSLMILTNGLFPGNGQLLHDLYHVVGLGVNFFGGGCGFGDFVSRPCLFSNLGVLRDGALLLPLKATGHIGVGHGFRPVFGPMVASRTEGRAILELNWEPALEVYLPLAAQFEGGEIRSGEFVGLARRYPLGLVREGLPHLIRDPLMCGDDGSLICAAEIPENSSLFIMKGAPEEMAEAAAAAVREVGEEEAPLVLAFYCLARMLGLGDDFKKELETMSAALGENSRLMGPVTLGEIASNGNGTVQIFNKTMVLGGVHAG